MAARAPGTRPREPGFLCQGDLGPLAVRPCPGDGGRSARQDGFRLASPAAAARSVMPQTQSHMALGTRWSGRVVPAILCEASWTRVACTIGPTLGARDAQRHDARTAQDNPENLEIVRVIDKRPGGQRLRSGPGNPSLRSPATSVRHVVDPQAHLHRRRRAKDRWIVEVAEMADAEHAAIQLAEPAAERDVEPLTRAVAQCVCFSPPPGSPSPHPHRPCRAARCRCAAPFPPPTARQAPSARSDRRGGRCGTRGRSACRARRRATR